MIRNLEPWTREQLEEALKADRVQPWCERKHSLDDYKALRANNPPYHGAVDRAEPRPLVLPRRDELIRRNPRMSRQDIIIWQGREQTIEAWSIELNMRTEAFMTRLKSMPLARAMTLKRKK